jgi:hypothetical protein
LGKPHSKASRVRHALERYALIIAITGLCLCAASIYLLTLG